MLARLLSLVRRKPRSLTDGSGCIGASTGYMDDARGEWSELVSRAQHVSPSVVELSALSTSELPGLVDFLASDPPLHFRYTSVHGPSKGRFEDCSALAVQLAGLPDHIAGVVMHPETLDEPSAFRIVGRRLLLENMDRRKGDGRTVAELRRYFDLLPDARFCFDVAHAYHCDKSMSLAHALLDAFADRLQEVHLSSIEESGKHVQLRASDAHRFASVLDRCVHVPWILEAEPPLWLDMNEVRRAPVRARRLEDSELASPAL